MLRTIKEIRLVASLGLALLSSAGIKRDKTLKVLAQGPVHLGVLSKCQVKQITADTSTQRT